MSPFTPEQRKAIQTWTEQRDALLLEIGNYSTELGTLKNLTKEEGLALADLHIQIGEARGRISELTALEERHKNSVNAEVMELEVRKSRLEGDCLLIESQLNSAKREQGIVISATAALIASHDTMKDQAAVVNRVTGELIEISTKHLSEVNTVMVEIQKVSDQVIEKGNENVKQTGIILEKLPRYIFELQKPIRVRRVFHAPPGTVINPETPILPTVRQLRKP